MYSTIEVKLLRTIIVLAVHIKERGANAPSFHFRMFSMCVDALIKKLQKMNPDAVVHLHHKDGDEVLFIMAQQNDNSVVWL